MATTCFGESGSEDAELATFVAEDAGPPGTPLLPGRKQGARTGSAAAPSDQEVGLAPDQMRLTIEDGLLMVLGPEGDPVPPQAVAAAAAAHPGRQLRFPDGTTVATSRVVTVLGAQTLGRLGTRETGDAWIMAMLREGGATEPASGEALPPEPGSERAQPAVEQTPRATQCGDEPDLSGGRGTLAAHAVVAAGRPSERAERGVPARRADPAPHGGALFSAPDPAPARQAAASEPGPEASPAVEPARGEAAPGDAGPDFEVLAERLAGPSAYEPRDAQRPTQVRADAEVAQTDLDPERMVLVVIRGVPEHARLSAGVRDDDGSWMISPLDLSTVTIALAHAGTDRDCVAGEGPGSEGDLSITGIALTDDGDLVSISETVPISDYLPDPDERGRAADSPPPAQAGGTRPGDDAGAPPEPCRIALQLEPQGWSGGAGAFDALVIRDLPTGARLSAGAHDDAIGGWVLRPQDIGGLAILLPPDLRADFTVTLLGIALGAGKADATRVLARLPVRVA